MATAPPAPNRTTWLVTAGALMFAVIQYGILLRFFLGNSSRPAGPPSAAMQPLFMTGALVALLASIMWTRLRVPPLGGTTSTPLPNPAAFQAQSIISLALAESAAIMGFVFCLVTSGSLSDYLPFGIGSLAVLTGVCVPKGFAYWAAWDSGGGDGIEGAPPPIG